MFVETRMNRQSSGKVFLKFPRKFGEIRCETEAPRGFMPPIGLFSSDVIALKTGYGEGEKKLRQKLSKKHDAFKWPVAYCRGFSFVAGLSKSDSVSRIFFRSCTALTVSDLRPTVPNKCHGIAPRRFSARKTGIELKVSARSAKRLVYM